MLIETHAHIYDSQFDKDRDAMLQRAFDVEISQIWMPNCNQETIDCMLFLEQKYPDKCLSMMGLHPCYVNENYQQELRIIEMWLSKRKFFMIGEIGLDYFWDLTFSKQQEEVFLQQLAWAKEFDIPICIHSRGSKDGNMNAIQRCCELIEQFAWNDLRGIFHCFSGNLEDARRAVGLNFLLGIGGVATFKNGGLDTILPIIGLENLVLETDAPYLAPVPHRGKRNEVAYIKLVATKVAEILNISVLEVNSITNLNAQKLIQKF